MRLSELCPFQGIASIAAPAMQALEVARFGPETNWECLGPSLSWLCARCRQRHISERRLFG